MNSRDTWHELRALRAEPPGEARRGARAALFRSALEQSEQLAESASVSGYAARPLLLYYMVNQAARAIVAAQGDVSNAVGHGLGARNLDGALSDVVVAADGGGLIAALADALRPGHLNFEVSGLVGAIPVGVLWAYLPRCGTWAAQAGLAHACALSIDDETPSSSDDGRKTVRVSAWPWPRAHLGPLTLNEIAERAEELVRKHYGVSTGWKVRQTPSSAFFGDMPLVSLDGKVGLVAVEFALERHPRDPGSTLGEISAWENFGTTHRSQGEIWVLPALPDSRHIHPLVAWYATLYVFSMLARYVPVAWSRHLDVDGSPYAVALQRTLDLALDDVPALVQQALDDGDVL